MEKRGKAGKRKKVRRDITHRNMTIVERARELEEALKYVALFLAFCLAFYLVYYFLRSVSYTHLTLPTKRIV